MVDLLATHSLILIWPTNFKGSYMYYSLFLCISLGIFARGIWLYNGVKSVGTFTLILVKLEPPLPQTMLKFEQNGWKWFLEVGNIG